MPVDARAPDGGVELVGYDREGKPLSVAVPTTTNAVEVEEEVRAAGGRILGSRVIRLDRSRPAGVSAEDFARFNELLATSVRRGVPMAEGVRRMADEMARGGGRFQTGLNEVQARLARGATLREAFDPAATGFPALYGRLIEAGAAAGDLSGVLLAFSRNVRVNALFRRGILEACIYPALLLIVCLLFLGAFGMMLTTRFEPVADALTMQLPALTETMVAQNLLGAVVWSVTIIGIVVGLSLLMWSALSREGRLFVERLLLTIPLYGEMYEAAQWSNAADMLALLLRARVPLPTALRLVGPATGTVRLAEAFERMAHDVAQGRPLSDAARRDRAAPARFARAADAGEVNGDLGAAMSGLAQDYRRQTERKADHVVRYLPAVLAVSFGVLILLIALTVFIPVLRFWGAAW